MVKLTCESILSADRKDSCNELSFPVEEWIGGTESAADGLIIVSGKGKRFVDSSSKIGSSTSSGISKSV